MSPADDKEIDMPRETLLYCSYATERSPLPMVAVEGLTHVVRYVNPAFCKLAGKERAELIGRRFAEAVPEKEENLCVSLLDRVYRTGEAENLAEQEHSISDAHTVFWSYAVWPVIGVDAHPTGVMIQVTDTTEMAVFRRQVVAMNQELTISGVRQHELTDLAERFAQRLRQAMRETNHRVKNNLQSIAALLDIRIMESDAAVSVEELTQLQLQITTLAAIHDMLTQDVSDDPIANPMSSREAFQRLLPMLQQIVGKERIRWTLDDLRLPVKHGMALAMLINELVCNAVKHGGKMVDVELGASETTVLLKVLDNGPGFPEGFNPRTDSNFGLDLVESVTRLELGGSVRFTNRAEGGACVAVSFPTSI